jgi:TRAP-type mannitol/chloroaromatic compound transport system permease large subunit
LGESVGTLFAAALLPGLVLAGIFCIYLLLLGVFRSHLVPPVALAERQTLSRGDLWRKALQSGLPPFLLVIAVLGSIIGGVAAPTEAASMGALGSVLVVALSGRLSPSVLRNTVQSTARITAQMTFILICAQVFALAFGACAASSLCMRCSAQCRAVSTAPLFFMLLLIFVLGFFIEWIEISYIVVPLLQAGNADMVWVATLIAVMLQTSFLTPPFGWALFYLRGVAPPDVPTSAIYVGVIPFIMLQLIACVLVFTFPGLATALPKAIGW